MMGRAWVGPLLFLAAALQLGTDSLTAQHISVSLGENRQEVLQPSAQITLPVLVDMTNADTLDIASLQLRLTWDTAVVGYASWSAGAFGTIEANEDAVAGGTFQANLISTTGTSNSFTAMNVTFDAGTAGSTIALLEILAAGSESGGNLLSRIVANNLSICIDAGGLLGDVTSGDLVDVIDAQQIARWLVGLAVGSSERMRSHGDVNNDGQTNIVDAQQVARSAVELPVEYPIGDAIVLNCSDALTVSTTSLLTAWTGNEYSQQLSAVGAGDTHSWAISGGTLPAGLSVVGSTISGTPTANGTSEFTVKVTSGDGQIATRPLSIKVSTATVTLSNTSLAFVSLGDTTSLTSTVKDEAGDTIPDATVTWISSDTTIATVSSAGLVTAIANGTATITATSTWTTGVASKTASVTVSQVVSSVTLSPTSLSFASFADTATLTPTVKDVNDSTMASPTVTWATSDTTVATVSAAGLVTAVANGTATITATSGSASATVSVTVAQAASTIEVSPSTLTLISITGTTTLTATVKDALGNTMAGATVTWSSSNTGIATVSSAGLVTSVADGTATITATSGSLTGTAAVTVKETQAGSVSGGGWQTCEVTTAGEAYCWGSNSNGQIGDGTTTDRLTPTLVSGGHTWASVNTTYYHICGVTTAGEAYCWGSNSMGKLGDGTLTDRLTPTLVSGGHTWASVNGGEHHTCGMTTVGTLYCWGHNSNGKLGDGTTTQRSTPTLVSGGHAWASMESGQSHTCGETTAGELYCWGAYSFGQLGDGTTTQRLTPTLVSGGHTWASVGGGAYHTCGVTTTGEAYCWGHNSNGKLGDGTTTSSSAPTLVSGGHTWASVSGGEHHTCGMTTAGDAYCWGRNILGQLGDGTTTQRSTPTLVSGGHAWASVNAGFEHTCAETAAGALYCWGSNSNGQLGDGTSSNSLVPVKVDGNW